MQIANVEDVWQIFYGNTLAGAATPLRHAHRHYCVMHTAITASCTAAPHTAAPHTAAPHTAITA